MGDGCPALAAPWGGSDEGTTQRTVLRVGKEEELSRDSVPRGGLSEKGMLGQDLREQPP